MYRIAKVEIQQYITIRYRALVLCTLTTESVIAKCPTSFSNYASCSKVISQLDSQGCLVL